MHRHFGKRLGRRTGRSPRYRGPRCQAALPDLRARCAPSPAARLCRNLADVEALDAIPRGAIHRHRSRPARDRRFCHRRGWDRRSPRQIAACRSLHSQRRREVSRRFLRTGPKQSATTLQSQAVEAKLSCRETALDWCRSMIRDHRIDLARERQLISSQSRNSDACVTKES